MNGPAHQASDRAASWILRQEEADWNDAQQEEFETWLQESVLHRVAYLRLRHSWRQADAITRDDACSESTIGGATHARIPGRRWQPWALAASLAALIGVGSSSLWHEPIPVAVVAYSTPVGAHETIALSDGSKLELNTATQVRTAISNAAREIWLDRGEAYFEVARRDGQPFIVHAGDRKVTVLGTKFSVRRDGEKISVAVVEGRVRVDDARNPAAVRSAIINGGDLAIARGPSALIAVRAEDKVAEALAWRDGMLSFSDTTLADAAAEFSRYGGRPILVTDQQVAAIRIDGAFRADNVDAFLRLLSDAYDLRVEENSKEVRISR